MPSRTRLLVAAAFLAALAVPPAAQAQHYRDHRGGHYYRYEGHRHGDEVGAAILGGIIGLGLGAAIAGASQPPPPTYYPPPPAYSPPPGYYYPPSYYNPPPPNYYGYDPY